MSRRPVRPARTLPAAEWWAPLLVDLGAVQYGSTDLGLCVRDVDLTTGRARVTVQWSGTPGTPGTELLLADPEAGRDVLLREIAAAGPARLAADEFPPLTGHAWLLDELGRRSDAWYAYLAEPVDLLRVVTDGHGTTDVAVQRTARGDVVVVHVPLAGLGDDDVGLAYTIAERAVTVPPHDLRPAGTVQGRPAFTAHLPGEG
ncbi:hypothetical protein [Streptomyces morookaense]|uniref:Uncharacterized protein n=1 Tax=Streptomyces morookaense TaxID=1970 RepID=A0A7Y7BAC7_STRMO|nr:hypothetical protein [Streptomyces morookaense]NVK81967.1 hypothetical protein [Streptomyces morookaense]GHF39451.1 hypothetical protein GCM10010359_47840 [Streptomyces morookaense]